ncbi:MAG: CHAD domain-containing protein [Methanolobus sp.]|nr:CHAD domain-containing protein [Methanolobus sp.]
MTGLLFAMVSRLSRSSDPEVILVVCSLLGAGILLILAGINIAGIRRKLSGNYSFIAALVLSALGLTVFTFSFPGNWFYPRVSYVIVSYSLGIFLLLINIFVNYFLYTSKTSSGRTIDPHESFTCTGASDSTNVPGQHNDCSVLATFAGILVTNITSIASASYEPYFVDNDSDENDMFVVMENEPAQSRLQSGNMTDNGKIKDQNDKIDEGMEENMENSTDKNIDETANEKEASNDGYTEPTALETTQFPEVVDVAVTEIDTHYEENVTEECGLSPELKEYEDLTTSKTAIPVPFSEFRTMKKTDIRADDTMRAAARKILMFHFGAMIEHERGTKVGKDIEELHDMRVAAMRMRSAVEVLEGYLDMDEMSPYRKNIKSVRKVLGSVRDLDVFLEKIDHYLADQPPERRAQMDPLTDSILIEKAKNRGTMLVYLDDSKYNKFKKNFADYLLHKKSWKMRSVKKNGEPVPYKVMDVLPVLLYTQFAAVRAYDNVVSDEAIDDPSLEKYHQLRIDVKILRYTLEFFREVLGPESKELIKYLKALQDNLGDMHDTVVALELLKKFEERGSWGESRKEGKNMSGELQKYPGVDAYIEYRKQELESLLETFPDVWSNVIDPDFSVSFSKAISGIYTS